MTEQTSRKYIEMIDNRPSFLEDNKKVIRDIIKTYCGEIELQKYFKESNDNFENRKKITAGTNTFAQNIKMLIGKLNTNQIIMGTGYDKITAFDKDNVDGFGMSLENFLVKITTELLLQGFVGVVPYKTKSGKILLRYHTHLDFIGYLLSDDYSEIKAVGFEEEREIFKNGEYEKKILYKFYDSDGLTVYIKNEETKDYQQIARYSIKTGFLPISLMFSGIQKRLFDIIPEFKAEAYLNIKINNLESVVADTLYKQHQALTIIYTKKPIHNEKRVKLNENGEEIHVDNPMSNDMMDPIKQMQMGDTLILNDKQNEGGEIVEYDNAPLLKINDEIANLKNTIHNGMYNRNQRTDLVKNKTRQEAEGENQEEKSFFSTKINTLERMLIEVFKHRIARDMCKKNIDDEKEDYNIEIKNNTNKSILFDNEFAHFVKLVQSGHMSLEAFYSIMKSNDSIDKDFNIPKEIERIKKEREELTSQLMSHDIETEADDEK